MNRPIDKMLVRDLIGKTVVLTRDIEKVQGAIFPKGTPMLIASAWRGVFDLKKIEYCEHCTGRGWVTVSKVPRSAFDLATGADLSSEQ